MLEKYIILRPLLEKVLPSSTSPILDQFDENGGTLCIDVLCEDLWVSGILETDHSVKSSRHTRLLKQLTDTLDLLGTSRGTRLSRHSFTEKL